LVSLRDAAKSSSVTATEAKNQFGQLLERAIKGERVYITRHEAPKAVLISVDDFQALAAHATTKLDSLRGEFDALLARMQGPGARAAMKAAFGASPDELGIAAVEAAKKRD
jgi:antitoxin Phd